MPRTHVTFFAPGFVSAQDDDERGHAEARLEDEQADEERWGEGPTPPGAALTAWLTERLEAAGGWTVAHRWTTPYGHAFDARRAGGARHDVEIRALGERDGAWLVTAKPRAGLFKKLFARGGDPKAHALLCANLHEALELDARVSDVTWFDEDAWESGDPGRGARGPGH